MQGCDTKHWRHFLCLTKYENWAKCKFKEQNIIMYVYLTKYTKLAFVNFDWLNILYDGPWRAVLWVSLPTVIMVCTSR